MFHFLRGLENKLFPCFLWIIELIIIETSVIPIFVYFDGPKSGDNPVFMSWLNKGLA